MDWCEQKVKCNKEEDEVGREKEGGVGWMVDEDMVEKDGFHHAKQN